MKESEKVLLIRDKDGMLFDVGHPSLFRGAEITKHLKNGCTLETTTIDEYRSKGLLLYEIN